VRNEAPDIGASFSSSFAARRLRAVLLVGVVLFVIVVVLVFLAIAAVLILAGMARDVHQVAAWRLLDTSLALFAFTISVVRLVIRIVVRNTVNAVFAVRCSVT
jgi:hypothetical protein